MVIVDPNRLPARVLSGNVPKTFHAVPYESYTPEEKFDYIILNCALGETEDICRLLKNMLSGCTPSTRIIIYQHNHLWQGILNLGARLDLKRKERIQNWLSIRDLEAYLNAMGFETVRTFRQTILPVRMGVLGPLINGLAALLPFFDFLMLDQFIVARSVPGRKADETDAGLTICITVQNEKGNIEPIVKSLPRVCDKQEILFVEGHSTDGTRDEIKRVMNSYPEKRVRLIGQPGKGQGDAIRVGFQDAREEIIIVYEGDGTSVPEDIHYFYDAMRENRFEFIEGSRFVYPLNQQAMPLLNRIGNILFAKWFSWFLGQNVTDVLSGIKAINKKSYQVIYDHWGFLGVEDPFGDFELLYGAARFGLKVGEIPIRYRPRPYGESKTRPFRHGLMLLKMIVVGQWIFRTMAIK